MHRFALLLGMGTSLVAASACAATPRTPLTTAAAANDIDAIHRLLADGHAPDEFSDAWTPLIWAARRGALDAIAVLLDAGAEIDGQDRAAARWTPLQHAIHRRQTAAARLLLERGAEPNASAAPGSLTPLLMAADDPDPTSVQLLLTHGADPRVSGEYGDTPLSRAVSGGAMSDIDSPLLGGCRAASVRVLLAHDPTLRLPDNFAGRQALWWARFHGCAQVLKMVRG
jgi:ankyrin repeat protein